MQKGKKAVEIDVFLNKASLIFGILNISFLFNRTHMAKDIFVAFTCIFALAIGYHCMHSELRIFIFFNDMGSHRRCYDIGHIGASLG